VAESATQRVATPATEADVFEGKTIKFSRPTAEQGTLQLLPGRLQIIEGEDRGQEIRFKKPAGGAPEITFGRKPGPALTHVQLKAQTVSRDHAVMRRVDGQWQIVNRSQTNPVRVNGQALSADGGSAVIKDGDTIEMGEVTFRFKER